MSSIVKLVEKSRYHLETFFPGWITTKDTIMIPPEPITNFPGPIQKSASGYSGELVTKKGPIIDGDSAEAAVHSFLLKSNQHAFALQNYTTSKWKRILKSRGYDASDNFSAEMMEIEYLEIDFLVLHAYAGIIAFECKAVKSFQSNRYSDSKKQLDRLELMIEKLTRLLKSESGEPLDHVIPVKKVISFSFVEMKQDVKNPFNLGKTDIDADAKSWWNRLLNKKECEVNLFSKNRFYQNLVITMVGMYNAVELSIDENLMDVYRTIDEQSFYDGCSSSDVTTRNSQEREYFDRLFFLNPEQQSVLQCRVKKQLLYGEFGTGKTILLMQKALIALRNGEKIAFIVPECLEPKYNSFKRKYNGSGECAVLAFKNSLLLFGKEEKQAGADIISTLQDPNVSLFLDEWQKFVIPAKDNLSFINYNNQPSLREENLQNDFIKTCQEILTGRTANTCVVLSAGTRFGSTERYSMHPPIYRNVIDQFLEKDFQLLSLTSILRGTCHIVGQWLNLSQLSGLSWSSYCGVRTKLLKDHASAKVYEKQLCGYGIRKRWHTFHCKHPREKLVCSSRKT